MKKGILMVLMAISMVFVMSSCMRRDAVAVREFEGIALDGMSRMSISLKVENSSASKITLRQGKMSFSRSGAKILDLMLTEPVVLSRKSLQSVTVPLRMKVPNPLAAIALAKNFEKNMESVTVSGEFTAKVGWMRKKIVLDKVPLSQIMTNFGVDINKVANSISF